MYKYFQLTHQQNRLFVQPRNNIKYGIIQDTFDPPLGYEAFSQSVWGLHPFVHTKVCNETRGKKKAELHAPYVHLRVRIIGSG